MIHLKALYLFYIRPQRCHSLLFHRRRAWTSMICIITSSLMILSFLSLFQLFYMSLLSKKRKQKEKKKTILNMKFNHTRVNTTSLIQMEYKKNLQRESKYLILCTSHLFLLLSSFSNFKCLLLKISSSRFSVPSIV